MRAIELSNASDIIEHLQDFYQEIAFDDSPVIEKYTPTGVWFSLYKEDCFAGFINLKPLNNVMWEAHIMVYEKFRGTGSEEWGILAAQYAGEHLGAKKILAITPYIPAKKYAEKVGFIYSTILKRSIKKNGQLLDQYLLEKEM